MDMNYDELTALMEHVEELYAALENPTVDDEDYYLLLKDAFGPLLVCPDCFGEMGEHTEECPRVSSGIFVWEDDHVFTKNDTINREITVKTQQGANTEVNWTIHNNITVTIDTSLEARRG